MDDNARLIELVESAAGAFGINGIPDKEGLSKVLADLTVFLADCEGLEIEVFDTLWQASRKLQECLAEKKELDAALLAGIHEQLASIASPQSAPETPLEEKPDGARKPYTIPDDDIALVEDFIMEATEHLETSESAMLTLETHLEDSDTLNLIFRAFHTIKGMAGFMNLEEIGILTHNAENLLDMARNGELLLSGKNADAVFKSIDMLKTMLDALRSAIANGGILSPQDGLHELADYLKTCTDGTAELPSSSAAAPAGKPEGTELPAAASTSTAKRNPAQLDEKIKVSTDRLDSLVNMVGELVIAQLMVAESLRTEKSCNNELLRNTVQQGKIIRELQELAMAMRMVPINGIFQKMARMTRDLSKKAEKPVNLIMEGEQTELDRTIVDKLADPLVHMIRNSVDHGIETAEERIAAGKPVNGQIILKASHSAGSIVIEIKDDGRGLNREKLLEKALFRGAISPDKNPTDQEIFATIFLPGLSTAEAITSISGRGVGMDVVRRNIEELRGRIDIASTQGKGTVFTVTVPLTLAVIDGQIVRIGNERYIIPINNIRRSFRPLPEQISTVHGRREMVMVRDELLPLVRLYSLFNIEPDSTVPTEGLVVVVEEDNEACCLLVDDLLDQQQVVIKSLGSILSQTDGISGGAIMGDGMVRLILDIPGVIKLFRS